MWPGDALPQRGNANWKVFYAASADWQTYMKPPGASMIYILMLGSGAGGSRVANGSVTQGGGGGGGGGMVRAFIPAALLPDIIYVRPGRGGLGATSPATTGGAGEDSFVSIAASTTTSNLIIRTNGAAAPSTTQAGGGGGPSSSLASAAFASFGLWSSIAGQLGGAGSVAANSNGASVTPGQSGVISTGGAGGANGTGTPGSITANGLFPGIATDTSVPNGAREGFQKGAIIAPGLKSFPLIFTGGTGGVGVSTATTAGNGGNASYGGGGGGGGSGTNVGSISGNGGNGGDGLIIIGAL